VQGAPEEHAGPGVFGPIGSALSSVDGPRNTMRSALVAAAMLVLLLLGLVAAAFPVRATAGAVLLHLRGSHVLVGGAVLAIAVAVFVFLSLL
jgi:hypothetical protein